MVARGGFEPPQAASKAAVLTITQPGNQKLRQHYSIYSLKYPHVFFKLGKTLPIDATRTRSLQFQIYFFGAFNHPAERKLLKRRSAEISEFHLGNADNRVSEGRDLGFAM